MYTTTQVDNGLINNYAVEPEIYYAKYPAPYQQRRYLFQGMIASLFILGLIIVSTIIS